MDNQLFKQFAKGKKITKSVSNDCVIYTRVSSAKQMDGLSLETQLKYTKEYAEKQKLNVREHFGGTHESAKTDERKEFKRMLDYIRKPKCSVSKVLVYSLERFSRSEDSVALINKLRKIGVEVVSVTQPIDTNNPTGLFQQKVIMAVGEFDNGIRRSKCMEGVKARLEKGEWCTRPPVGYDIVRSNGVRRIVLNKQSKIIEKIFLWKGEERLNNEEIRKRLVTYKVNYSLRRIGEILVNPFYCGKLVHHALEGTTVDGKHEKLISEELFLRVNGIIAEKKLGLQTKRERKEIALKRFMKCEQCGKGMRGYISKGWNLPYYKCNTKGCRCNKNGNEVNDKFLDMLRKYEIKKEYIPLFRYQLNYMFTHLNGSYTELVREARQRIAEIDKKLERIEERFILEEISVDLYQKYKGKFEEEKAEISSEVSKCSVNMSKLDEHVNFSVSVCSNLSKIWSEGDYTERQELQNMFFPSGICYNRKTDECRNEEVCDFLQEIEDISRSLNDGSVFDPKRIDLSSPQSNRAESGSRQTSS